MISPSLGWRYQCWISKLIHKIQPKLSKEYKLSDYFNDFMNSDDPFEDKTQTYRIDMRSELLKIPGVFRTFWRQDLQKYPIHFWTGMPGIVDTGYSKIWTMKKQVHVAAHNQTVMKGNGDM